MPANEPKAKKVRYVGPPHTRNLAFPSHHLTVSVEEMTAEKLDVLQQQYPLIEWEKYFVQG